MSFYDFFPPLTPEQVQAHERRLETTVKAALPLVREARRALREIRALGMNHCQDNFYKAQKHLALMEDGLENILAAPSRLEDS